MDAISSIIAVVMVAVTSVSVGSIAEGKKASDENGSPRSDHIKQVMSTEYATVMSVNQWRRRDQFGMA
ncbi:hypothetical protein GGS24DRAFT_507552 [Hypoxylon argillaceum]|nr:hypothetical protein GGS24DRAFT_507552 [Hypoxylon argillaceum]